jgi:hypothetical protein
MVCGASSLIDWESSSVGCSRWLADFDVVFVDASLQKWSLKNPLVHY